MKSVNLLYTPNASYKEVIKPYLKHKYSDILIQVFTHKCDEQFISALVSELDAFIPQAKILGCTTDGEILASSVYTLTTVLSFSFFEKTQLTLYNSDGEEKDSFQKGAKLALDLVCPNTKAVICFADGLYTNADEFLHGFAKVCPDVIISGGLAGDNASFEGTYVFTNEGIISNGVVAVSFVGDDLHVVTEYSFGWIPIGKKMLVTKANKNRLYTLDNQNVADVYSRYLGEEAGTKLPAIGIEFPLIVVHNEDKYARAVLAKHEDGSLTFAGNIEEGEYVYFGVGEVNHILLQSRELYDEMSQYPLESIFSYSCMARRRFLNKNASLEFEDLSHIAPIAGFCTYGEFFHREQTNYLFNQTTTLIGMWEDGSKHPQGAFSKDIKVVKNHSLGTLRAMTHLINVVTHELAEANNKIEEKSKMMLVQSRLSAMGEMVGNIAHQWRQPLNALALMIQDLEEAYEFEELDKVYLEEMVRKSMHQINYMSRTIDDFRNFLHPNRIKEKFMLHEAILSSFNLLKGALSHSMIELSIENGIDARIRGNENEFMQVMINIINNAKDALLASKVKERKIMISISTKQDFVITKICDNGDGIEPNIIDNIFDPYFTTKGLANGSGLGLYMSKWIVEQRMQGTIAVQSATDGTCFYLTFPYEKSKNEE